MTANASDPKPDAQLHVYQTESDEDYFLLNTNTVLLGFLGAVAVVLMVLMTAGWLLRGMWS